jgi:hypothetical protein
LLKNPPIQPDRTVHLLSLVIREDEPRHWAPYVRWLEQHGCREPVWWERAIDRFIHSELLVLKLPILFLSPGLKRRTHWPDADDAIEPETIASALPQFAEAGRF